MVRCGSCAADFNSEDALAQHRNAKHGSEQKKQYIAYGIIGAIVIIAIVYFAFVRSPDVADDTPGNIASDKLVLTPLSSEGTALHIHPELEIVINGEKQIMPTNIGIFGYQMSVLHTHDATGVVHVESHVVKDFQLRQFFLIWSKSSGKEKVFNSTCIFDYCSDGNKTVKMFLNNEPNFEYENLILGDRDKIRIEYS